MSDSLGDGIPDKKPIWPKLPGIPPEAMEGFKALAANPLYQVFEKIDGKLVAKINRDRNASPWNRKVHIFHGITPVTHLPTGIVTQAENVSQMKAKAEALAELETELVRRKL